MKPGLRAIPGKKSFESRSYCTFKEISPAPKPPRFHIIEEYFSPRKNLMCVFSIISMTDEHRKANNEAIIEDSSIGEAMIHHMEDGRPVFVSPKATESHIDGFYIPCVDDEEAHDLACQGVIIFDGDKIYDSLTQREKNVFDACIEDECYVDNPVVKKIASALLLQKSSDDSVLDLPIRYYYAAAPVLLPNEFEFLKTAKKSNVAITINAVHAQINYP